MLLYPITFFTVIFLLHLLAIPPSIVDLYNLEHLNLFNNFIEVCFYIVLYAYVIICYFYG